MSRFARVDTSEENKKIDSVGRDYLLEIVMMLRMFTRLKGSG